MCQAVRNSADLCSRVVCSSGSRESVLFATRLPPTPAPTHRSFVSSSQTPVPVPTHARCHPYVRIGKGPNGYGRGRVTGAIIVFELLPPWQTRRDPFAALGLFGLRDPGSIPGLVQRRFETSGDVSFAQQRRVLAGRPTDAKRRTTSQYAFTLPCGHIIPPYPL